MINDKINKKVFIAPGAYVVGNIRLGKMVGIWYNAVLRGDSDAIEICDQSNIQDNCTIHTDFGYKVEIGKGVSIGHNAIIHGCKIGDNSVIGMGSIILNGAKIGSNCIIGAGSLITGNTIIPDNSLAFGNPAKIIRPLTDEEIEANRHNAAHYVKLVEQNINI